MPQPETKLRGHFLRYGEIIADERPRDYYDQRPEQYVHAQLLIFGVAAVDDGRHEQAGGKKGGRDPQHRALHMPCARQRVGKPLRDIDAVEALSLDRIMGSEATEKHLEDEQRQHHEQIFTERALRWRQRRERQRITVRRDERRVVMLARSEEHTSELQALMRISYAV